MTKEKYSKADIEFLILLCKRFKQDDSARWSDFDRFFSNDYLVQHSLEKLQNFVIKKEKRYYLNPMKVDEVKEIIKIYHENELKNHFENVTRFLRDNGLIL